MCAHTRRNKWRTFRPCIHTRARTRAQQNSHVAKACEALFSGRGRKSLFLMITFFVPHMREHVEGFGDALGGGGTCL